MILVACHKKENWGEPLVNLCKALVDLTQAYPDIQVAFPLKYDAKIREVVLKNFDNNERIHLLDPIPFATFVEAMNRSHLIITDSACILEEGRALKKPVLLFQEGAEASAEPAHEGVRLTGQTRMSVVVETSRLLEDPDAYANMISESKSYGDGHASERIIQAIRHHFDLAGRPEDYKPKSSEQSPAPDKVHSVIKGEFGAARVGKTPAVGH